MLSIYYTSKPYNGYHYIIKRNYNSWVAFKTSAGFLNFLSRHQITLQKQDDDHIHPDGTVSQFFYSERNIEDKYFTSLDQLPPDAIKYKDLSNGSLVDCYYTKDAIYRPNPNAKEAYIPLSSDEKIEYVHNFL